MRLQLADLPRIGCPVSKQSRDLVNLLGLSLQQSEVSAWSTTEMKRKKLQVSLLSACSFVWSFFLFFSIWNKKKKRSKTVEENRGRSVQLWFREAHGPWVTLWFWDWEGGGRAGDWSAPLFFTRCCCCSPSPYIECPLRCSLCRGAEPRTCPHTSRCPVYVHEMACTARRKSTMNVWTSSRNGMKTSHEVIRCPRESVGLTCLRLKNPFLSQLGRYRDKAITREVSFIPWMIPSSFLLHGPLWKNTAQACNHANTITWNLWSLRYWKSRQLDESSKSSSELKKAFWMRGFQETSASPDAYETIIWRRSVLIDR